MSAKKLDLGKAVERELYEPKLMGKQARKPEKVDKNQKRDVNSQSFEIRLKTKADEERTKLAVENLEIGMTPDEVIKAVGKPNSTLEWYTGNLKYNYGDVWVVIEDGAVTCLVKAEHFEKYWSRSDYETRNPQAIVK
ncbi:MAG: hypothetical protein ACETWK_10245 [Candidatus Aminicenantaceae bacterium]